MKVELLTDAELARAAAMHEARAAEGLLTIEDSPVRPRVPPAGAVAVETEAPGSPPDANAPTGKRLAIDLRSPPRKAAKGGPCLVPGVPGASSASSSGAAPVPAQSSAPEQLVYGTLSQDLSQTTELEQMIQEGLRAEWEAIRGRSG